MFRTYHIPCTATTNHHLRTLLQSGEAKLPCLLRADRQTGGKGRGGRQWHSPQGNLYVSFALPPPDITEAPQLGFVMSLAAHDSLAQFLPSPPLQLKWPNDILYDGRKIGGLLLENDGDALIIGIGLNIMSHPTNTEKQPATCLADNIEIPPPSPQELCDSLTAHFTTRYEFWQTHGWEALLSEWRRRSHAIGDRMSVHWLGALQNGTFAGLGDDGSLLLQGDGEVLNISAGDVFLGDL